MTTFVTGRVQIVRGWMRIAYACYGRARGQGVVRTAFDELFASHAFSKRYAVESMSFVEALTDGLPHYGKTLDKAKLNGVAPAARELTCPGIPFGRCNFR